MLYIYLEHIYFNEIADELVAIFTQAGLPVRKTSTIYRFSSDDLYIMFGMHDYHGDTLPANYIVYQLEQSTGDCQSKWFTTKYWQILRGAREVWDYSLVNYMFLKQHNIPIVRYVPMGYMPTANRTKVGGSAPEKKEGVVGAPPPDVLFYGSLNDRRMRIIRELEEKGIRVAHYNSLWNTDRDQIIQRSRIILNLHFYDRSILETVRLSYLLSNSCLIVSEKSCDQVLDQSHAPYVHLVDSSEICNKVTSLLRDYPTSLIAHREAIKNYMKRPYSMQIPMQRINEQYRHLLRYKSAPNDDSEIKLHIPITDDSDLFHPKQEITESGEMVLKLPKYSNEQLPKVSIVTITYGRQQLFSLPIRNWNLFEYPHDKLEWIIVDDSETDELRHILPESSQIRYYHLSERKSIGFKRNYGINQATHDYIAFMDDDDYYYPLSIYARISLLLTYPQYKLVGVSSLDIYDVINDFSAKTNSPYLSEASMAFTKGFWLDRKFPETQPRLGEGYTFTIDRRHRIMTMPSCFNLIAMTHWTNYTQDNRSNTRLKLSRGDSILRVLDFSTKLFIFNLFDKVRKSHGVMATQSPHK